MAFIPTGAEALLDLSLSLAALEKAAGSRAVAHGHYTPPVSSISPITIELIGKNGFPTADIDPKNLLVLNGGAAEQGGSVVGWLQVPEYNDSVLVNLWYGTKGSFKKDGTLDPGVISYIGHYSVDFKNRKMRKGSRLPAGLFFWKSDLKNKPVGNNDVVIVRAVPSSKKGEAYVFKAPPNVYALENNSNIEFMPLDDRHPSQKVRDWAYHYVVDRNQAFEEILGMSEREIDPKLPANAQSSLSAPGQSFRVLIGAETELKAKDAYKNFLALPTQYHSDGYELVKNSPQFRTRSVKNLRNDYRNYNRESFRRYLSERGKLFILRRSQYGKNPWIANVSYLQALFSNEIFSGKMAVFQTASTPFSLEGHMNDYSRSLDTMNWAPVQGEDAALGTMSAVIYRRYFVDKKDKNLLIDLEWLCNGVTNDDNPSLTSLKIPLNDFNYTGLNADQWLSVAIGGYVRVGVHVHIPVTSGLLEPDIRIPRKRGSFVTSQKSQFRSVPAFNKRMPLGEKAAKRVTHAITSAIHLEDQHTDPRAEIAKHILYGMYEGTLLAAFDAFEGVAVASGAFKGSPGDLTAFLNPDNRYPRVFLTLVGGSAFKNDPQWILEALKMLAGLISISGLQVCLVVWDDMIDGAGRDVFLDGLDKLVNDINGDKATPESILWDKDTGFKKPPVGMKLGTHEIAFT